MGEEWGYPLNQKKQRMREYATNTEHLATVKGGAPKGVGGHDQKGGTQKKRMAPCTIVKKPGKKVAAAEPIKSSSKATPRKKMAEK